MLSTGNGNTLWDENLNESDFNLIGANLSFRKRVNPKQFDDILIKTQETFLTKLDKMQTFVKLSGVKLCPLRFDNFFSNFNKSKSIMT